MAKPTFNEAENFLLDSWEQARAFEEAMDSVRQKYQFVAQRIIDAASEEPYKFDYSDHYVTTSTYDGQLAFGRHSWVARDSDWITGLWLGDITLDSLVSSPNEPAWASVTGKKLFITREDGDKARQKLVAEIKNLLPAEQFRKLEFKDGSRQTIVVWDFSTKKELLASLREGDSSGFQKIIMEQVEIFSAMLPAIEPLLIRSQSPKE